MGMTRILGAVALACAASAGAQTAPAVPDEESTRYSQASAHFYKGEYLAALSLLEGRPDTSPTGSLFMQMRPTLDGFAVMTEARRRPRPATPEQMALYDGAEAREAIAEIVERAKRTRVVIVNETHDNPRDRAFILAVAEALRPLGYSVYAAEAFNNWANPVPAMSPIVRLAADRVPRRETGPYVVDPMFGRLIRRTLELGYRPVAYEHASPPEAGAAPRTPEERIIARETGQAANLARAIAADPEAKFLVHVGYAHAAERPIMTGGQPVEWMAARLAGLTGIDPLTVEQTDLSEFEGLRGVHAALAPRVGSSAKVFFKDGTPVGLGILGEATDLQVVHPPITTVRGRPDWLARTGRRATEIPTEMLPRTGSRLVQVFAVGDPADAIPLDQALVTAGEAAPVLYVPDGPQLRWAVQDG